MAAVVVLGGHRCGTSAVAAIVHHLDVPAARDADLLGPSASNPRGHFEDRVFCRLHERMLGPGGWRSPRIETTGPNGRVQTAYQRHVAAREAHAPLWCLKDPRLCLLLPVLVKTLDSIGAGLRVVTVTRDVPAAAGSLHRRNRMPLGRASEIAHRYEGARQAQLAWLATRPDIPVREVGYEDAVRCPSAVAECVAAFLGRIVTPQAARAIDPSLKHF